MNTDDIRRLIDLMKENGLVEIEVDSEGGKIKLRRFENSVAPRPAHAEAPPAPAGAPLPGTANPKWLPFKSPLVGTFYRAPKPDSEPFVEVGDAVGPDRVVCIIEAMKVMNEIKAEMKGVVRDILVENGQAVEFGEPIFLIEPTA